MPIGIIADVASVAIGAIIGGVLKGRISEKVRESLFFINACTALCIGVNSFMKFDNMTVAVLSCVAGMIVGELLYIEDYIGALISKSIGKVGDGGNNDIGLLCTATAIFCFSGTGFFGALSEGLDNDASILLAKAIMDFFTAIALASETGAGMAALAIPQLVIFLLCYYLSAFLSPVLTEAAIANFKSCGGLLTIAIAYNLFAGRNNLKKMRILNGTPAFILVFLFTAVLQI